MSETPCVDGCGQDAATIERLCVVMHDAYEAAAIEAGWETQKPSRKPWMDVPEANKATMRVAVRALLDALSPQNHPRSAVDAPEAPGQPGRGERGSGGRVEALADLLWGVSNGYRTSWTHCEMAAESIQTDPGPLLDALAAAGVLQRDEDALEHYRHGVNSGTLRARNTPESVALAIRHHEHATHGPIGVERIEARTKFTHLTPWTEVQP